MFEIEFKIYWNKYFSFLMYSIMIFTIHDLIVFPLQLGGVL